MYSRSKKTSLSIQKTLMPNDLGVYWHPRDTSWAELCSRVGVHRPPQPPFHQRNTMRGLQRRICCPHKLGNEENQLLTAPHWDLHSSAKQNP